jgi:predicted acylesterase/phospholipase RssA
MSSNSTPLKFCDLIMKGGITSGVIYPRLVAELAKTHQLKCIGGTSAGAIAAAGAAAAQYGRTNGVTIKAGVSDPTVDLGPFEKLDRLPVELGEMVGKNQSRLLSFFKPQDPTRIPFDLLLKAIDKSRSGWKFTSDICWILAKQYWFVFIAFGLLAYGISRVIFAFGDLQLVITVALLLGFLILSFLVSGYIAIRKLLSDLTLQNFGIASGMPPASSKESDPPTLTPWLTNYFNSLAGKSKEMPLTFGDLWGPNPDKPNVDFRAVTTCLSLGRPYSMPFEDKDFYFSKAEWDKLFPSDVMTWLIQNERDSGTAKELRAAGVGDFYAMPERKNWPVVIAVRMSLSFPVLLAAIPMHRVLRSSEAKKLETIKVLFTDGGVSSNFPIHLFDSPFPTHPTFAVDLQNFPDTMTDEKERKEKRAFTFVGNRTGHQTPIHQIPDSKPLKQLLWFASRLIETMQNWRDQLPKNMAGYRDRIAYVQHTESEGGMNLNMNKSVIETLGKAGQLAAQKLNAAYYAPHDAYRGQTGWQNHQWIRMRSSLKQLDVLVKSVSEKLEQGYLQLPTESAPSYSFPRANSNMESPEQNKALALIKEIDELAIRMRQLQGNLATNAPESKLAFRITPEW